MKTLIVTTLAAIVLLAGCGSTSTHASNPCPAFEPGHVWNRCAINHNDQMIKRYEHEHAVKEYRARLRETEEGKLWMNCTATYCDWTPRHADSKDIDRKGSNP